jgi:hypothetical protein
MLRLPSANARLGDKANAATSNESQDGLWLIPQGAHRPLERLEAYFTIMGAAPRQNAHQVPTITQAPSPNNPPINSV